MTDVDVNTLSYEAALAELERTVQQLGRDVNDLADSVRLYERGLALARRCSELLKDAERRLGELAPTGKEAPAP
ncbi:MAG: exodeoxyribonuclease VII small subunit [Candidatus Dormibacter sp.]